MGIFNQRKPRRFNHQYIYVDERRERLQAIEERAKRELGMTPEPEKTTEERIRGRFVEQTTHLKRQQEKENPTSSNSNYYEENLLFIDCTIVYPAELICSSLDSNNITILCVARNSKRNDKILWLKT